MLTNLSTLQKVQVTGKKVTPLQVKVPDFFYSVRFKKVGTSYFLHVTKYFRFVT